MTRDGSVGDDHGLDSLASDKILDVATFRTTSLTGLVTECPRMVNVKFDQVEGYFLRGANDMVSTHRRVVGFRANGQAILQRTRTSAADFMVGPFSPGIPPAALRR